MNSKYYMRSALPGDERTLFKMLARVEHHRHLDWREPLSWIGSKPFLVAERGNEPVAALACPADVERVAWLRLFICLHEVETAACWRLLWLAAARELEADGGCTAAAIAMQAWMTPLLVESGFTIRQELVMLAWEHADSLEAAPLPAGVTIRPMVSRDLPAVVKVDHAAFAPLWQNSTADLTLAQARALLSAVAEVDGQVVGYQISTQTSIGVHLARLAILPAAQGLGIGQALVADMLTRAGRKGIDRFTVNTQSDNSSSLHLYRKLGFFETGERYPVYTRQLPA